MAAHRFWWMIEMTAEVCSWVGADYTGQRDLQALTLCSKSIYPIATDQLWSTLFSTTPLLRVITGRAGCPEYKDVQNVNRKEAALRWERYSHRVKRLTMPGHKRFEIPCAQLGDVADMLQCSPLLPRLRSLRCEDPDLLGVTSLFCQSLCSIDLLPPPSMILPRHATTGPLLRALQGHRCLLTRLRLSSSSESDVLDAIQMFPSLEDYAIPASSLSSPSVLNTVCTRLPLRTLRLYQDGPHSQEIFVAYSARYLSRSASHGMDRIIQLTLCGPVPFMDFALNALPSVSILRVEVEKPQGSLEALATFSQRFLTRFQESLVHVIFQDLNDLEDDSGGGRFLASLRGAPHIKCFWLTARSRTFTLTATQVVDCVSRWPALRSLKIVLARRHAFHGSILAELKAQCPRLRELHLSVSLYTVSDIPAIQDTPAGRHPLRILHIHPPTCEFQNGDGIRRERPCLVADSIGPGHRKCRDGYEARVPGSHINRLLDYIATLFPSLKEGESHPKPMHAMTFQTLYNL